MAFLASPTSPVSQISAVACASAGSRLRTLGAQLQYFDPFVSHWDLGPVTLTAAGTPEELLSTSDLVVHLQPSATYPTSLLAKSATLVLDTNGHLSGDNIHRL